MPRSRWAPCPHPGCAELVDRTIGDCPAGHARAKRKAAQQRTDAARPSPAARGYGPAWARTSAAFLQAHPTCIDCGGRANHSDHAPTSRAALVRTGDPNPDAWHHLQPRCHRCHSAKTAKTDGGYGNPMHPTA